MDESIVAIIATFGSILMLSFGIPLMRAWIRRMDAKPLPGPPDVVMRLDRIEHAIDAMAVEVERISEGQRFVTRLMAERAPEPIALPHAEREATSRRPS
jgi:hypothetical protein